jgi:hypothetical protein
MAVATERPYRNPFEQKIGDQLDAAGIVFEYESQRLPVEIPARIAAYLPDFPITDTNILIEGKGAFGGGRVNYNATSAAARQKMILFKEQHPDIDLRFVFSNAKAKIYTGSKTTYGQWCDDHGFLWSDKGIVPPSWIEEIKQQQRKAKRNGKPRRDDQHEQEDAPRAQRPVGGAHRGRTLGAR